MADLAEFLGVEDTEVRRKLKALGGVSTGQIPFTESARLVTKQKAGTDTRDALRVIELENARLEQMKLAGELCLLSDAKLFWSNERISVRQLVERADYLSEPSKRKLLTQLRGVKTKAPEACE